MRAFILAAGEGTRLRPLTSNIPKPLLTLAGKPYLTHLMESLRSAGVEDVTILVGWKANRIKEHYGDGSSLGLKVSFLEQKERLGTANAIGIAEGHIDEDEFFSVTGALIGPRLPAIASYVASGDEAGLARELADIKSMY
jgi:bifunctional UDP-N-acetylglucosamine pyrophosphorylase/glucosamine-1-phosphate N-acetyltransferase